MFRDGAAFLIIIFIICFSYGRLALNVMVPILAAINRTSSVILPRNHNDRVSRRTI